LQTLETDEDKAMSFRLDEMTGSIARHSSRIAELEEQAAFLQRLRREVPAF